MVAVLVICGSSIAAASAADAQTAIKACINNKSHAVRLIPTTGVCKKTETLDTVGATGPQGPPGSADAWSLIGNTGTSAGTNFIGTIDNQPFEIHVDGARVMRYEPGDGILPNVIGGFSGNSVTAGIQGATIGGGGLDGGSNQVTGTLGTVGGGQANVAGDHGTVGGGRGNSATADFSSVGGGLNNTASGPEATVAGGLHNTASGQSSFAAGTNAMAANDGAFVWSDNSSSKPWTSFLPNSFLVRATAGIALATAIDNNGIFSKGCVIDSNGNLLCTGTISSSSDRALKTGFEPAAGNDVLQSVAALPMSSWSFKGQTVRHIGPMAQDFHAAFKIGDDDKHISTTDEGGVALAAIQGLYRMMQAKDDQLAEQARQIKLLTARLEKLEQVTQAGRDTDTMRPASSLQPPRRSPSTTF